MFLCIHSLRKKSWWSFITLLIAKVGMVPCYSCPSFASTGFDALKGSYDETSSGRQSTPVIKSLATRVLNRVRNKLSTFRKNAIPAISFFDCDFSMSEKGYFREPHHDNPHRIINFVLYFNTVPSDMGGSLEVFEYINQDRPVLCRQPPREDLHLVKEIQPTEGTLVLFLSTPLSIQG